METHKKENKCKKENNANLSTQRAKRSEGNIIATLTLVPPQTISTLQPPQKPQAQFKLYTE